MRVTDFLFIVFLWILSFKTRYRHLFTYFLFLILIANIITSLSYSSIRLYRRGDIKPGDVISTYQKQTPSSKILLFRTISTIATGDAYFHTALAVLYKGRTFVLNPCHNFDTYRKGSPYKKQIEVVSRSSNWCLFLEPLESFIYSERRTMSYLRINRIGKELVFEQELVDRLNNDSLYHCCSLIGKYLEGEELVSNISALSDVLYYTPDFFSRTFTATKEVKLF